MTGPEHYKRAEELLTPAKTRGPWADGSGDGVRPPTAEEVARAQVHATLALAAATGTFEPEGSRWQADTAAWLEATGAKG